MNFANVSLAAVLTVLLGGAACAAASEPSTLAGCTHLKKKVTEALNANQQSAHYGEAHNLAVSAGDYCSQGLYKYGIDRYAKALDLLGAG
jgi:hypothetical protein